MVVAFMEDQSTALVTWRNQDGNRPSTVVGVGSNVYLMDEEMDIMDTVSICGSSRIIRLVGMNDNGSMFYTSVDGSIGFVSSSLGPCKLGKSEQC